LLCNKSAYIHYLRMGVLCRYGTDIHAGAKREAPRQKKEKGEVRSQEARKVEGKYREGYKGINSNDINGGKAGQGAGTYKVFVN